MHKMNHQPEKSKERKYNEPEFWVKSPDELMKFLIASLPSKNRNNIKTLLRDRQVLVNGKVVTQFNHPLVEGQVVKIRREKEFSGEKALRGITILFEDKDLLIIDKHAGILSVATEKVKENTAYSILSSYLKVNNPKQKIFIVHRLDRETSGLMIFAKSEKIQHHLQESWHDTLTERTYLALTEGVVEKDKDTIESYLKESNAFVVYSTRNSEGAQRAVTHFEVLKRSDQYTLLKVNPETGRKNQIRVHMKDIGHSIAGDKKYGAKTNPIGRLGLHAWILGFIHPVTREKMRFETNIPMKIFEVVL
ncbi:MAG: RluA family pseudouridine synthase [Bacteroidales bacterium]|nr:RluA family pseudouridine synthase [Bacteroidales bacterium]